MQQQLPDALLARGATLVAEPYSLRSALAAQAALLAVERGEDDNSGDAAASLPPHLVLLAALRRGDVAAAAAAAALFAAGADAVVRGLVAPGVAASVAAQAQRHAEGAALLLAAADAADARTDDDDDDDDDGGDVRTAALLGAALVLLAAGRCAEAAEVRARLVRTGGPTAGAALLGALLAERPGAAVRALEDALRADAFSARSVRACVAVGLARCLRSPDADALARCTCAVAALAPRPDGGGATADACVLDALVGVLRVQRARGAPARAHAAAALHAMLQDALRAHPDDARLWALAAAAARDDAAGLRLEDAVACAAAPVPACPACLAAAVACATDRSAHDPARPAACACAAHVPARTAPPALVGRVVPCIPLFF